MTSDGELLRRYTESNSEDAFAELVRRHLDLVYSTALRQLSDDAHLAQDVAQSVFTDLARKAGSLVDRKALAGWLYTGAHYGAANAVRTERRRRNREQEAHAMQELLHDPGTNPDWESLRPVLDTAMHQLSEEDREVIVLRYFENRRHADIGEQFGLSENTARMRIERALEKLRTILSRRGITTSAAALSMVLTANAVQAAPVGLAVTISTAAALGGTTITAASTATATATKAIAMTTLQKTIVGATLSVAIGVGVYEAAQASNLRAEMQALQRQQAALNNQIPQLQRERGEARNQLASLTEADQSGSGDATELLRLRGEVGVLRRDSQEMAQLKAASRTNSAAEMELRAWVDRVKQLKEHSAANPNLQIPEFRLLTEQDWLDAVRGLGKPGVKPDPDFRRSMFCLRQAAEKAFAPMMQRALDKYSAANGGVFPTDVAQLKPYFEVAVDDAILQRYTIVPRDSPPFKDWNWSNLGKKNQVITQKSLIDEEYDAHIGITRGFWSYARRIVGGNPRP